MMANFPHGQGPLLEAVALRDPQTALILIRESLAKRPAWEYADARLGLLVRLNLLAAREDVRALLSQKNEKFLTSLVGQIAESTHDTNSPGAGRQGERRLRASRALSESLVPELARLYFSSPSAKVRQAARSAVTEITQLRSHPTKTSERVIRKNDLRTWWQKNAVRLGRSTTLMDLL